MVTGRLRRAGAGLLLALLVGSSTVVTASPASAHAVLVGSDPAPGEVLDQAPGAVRLLFDEPVHAVAEAVALYDDAGHVPAGVLSVTAVDGSVTVELVEDLPDGSYLLGWRVVSADSHPISGTLDFAVGERSVRAPVAPPSDDGGLDGVVGPLVLALQVVAWTGLLVASGLIFFGLVVGPEPGGTGSRGARWRAALLTGAAGAGASVLLAGATLVRERGGPVGDLATLAPWREAAGASPGLAALLAVVGTSVLLVGDRLGRRALSGLGACVALGSLLLVGHTRTVGPGPLMSVLDLVHVATAAVWLGGLVGLVIHLRRSRSDGTDPQAAAQVVARFSVLAGVLVLALGLSGAAMAALVLETPGALWSSAYGRALLVKLAVAAVAAVLATWNRWWLVPLVERRPGAGAQWSRLVTAVRDEGVVLATVVVLTGLLTLQSPRSPVAAPLAGADLVAADRATGPMRATLGEGSLQAQLQPASVGANRLSFTVRDADGEPLQLAGDPGVTVVLPDQQLGPLPVRLARLPGTSRWTAEFDVPVPGTWRVLVSTPLGDPDAVPDAGPAAQPVAVLDVTVG